MKEFIIGLTATYFVLAVVIYIVGTLSAFRAEWEEVNRIIAHSLPTERMYKTVRKRLESLHGYHFKSRRKMDELTKKFFRKFELQIYVDAEISKTKTFKRLVRLTA